MFILGDLFEVWVGDDIAERDFEARCTEVLARSGRGTGRSPSWPAIATSWSATRCSSRSACMRLPDPTLLVAFGQRVLLSHGDALCLGDVAYQRYRAHRPPPGRAARLAGAAATAGAAPSAGGCATQSEATKASGEAVYADVDTDAARGWLRESEAPVLVHGHTHRPASHALAPGLVRHVLSDWDLDGAGTRARRGAALDRGRLRPDRARSDRRRAERAVSGWLSRWRRQRTLERRPIPEPLWQLTLARFPFLAARSAEDLQALRDMTTLFLDRKEFTGARGLEVSDEMAVAIAAQACLPVLKLGLRMATTASSASSSTRTRSSRPREHDDEDGIVHAWDEELSGEAMERRPGDAGLARRRGRRRVGGRRLQRRRPRVRPRHRHARRRHRRASRASTRRASAASG